MSVEKVDSDLPEVGQVVIRTSELFSEKTKGVLEAVFGSCAPTFLGDSGVSKVIAMPKGCSPDKLLRHFAEAGLRVSATQASTTLDVTVVSNGANSSELVLPHPDPAAD